MVLLQKIHVVSDRDELALKIELTDGNIHGSVFAIDLSKNIKSDFLLGYKGYNSSK